MKKLIAMLLACVMLVGIVGCTQQNDTTETTTTPATTTAPETTTADTTADTTETEPVVEAYEGTRKTLFWYSESLQQDCNYSIYLPASYDETDTTQAYPVVYLMHGAGGHQLNLIERFSTPDILNELIGEGTLPECIVVFIDGYNSYYVDGPGLSMETAIIDELIPFIDETYNTLATKEGRMIGGISMGGYGAARFALKYPELFSTALLLSPAIWKDASAQGSVSGWHIFVDDEGNFSQDAWAAEHPLSYLDSYAAAESPVNFYVISGTDDATVPMADVESFCETLGTVANVELVEYEGGIHAWTTWKVTCKEALIYAASILNGTEYTVTDFAAEAEAAAAAAAATTVATEPVETEEPGYEGTRLTKFWYSETLKLDCNYSIYLPASYDENDETQAYPVIYLMHGVGGHQLNMIERFSTPDILNKLIGEGTLPECIVVFIDGYNSFYYDGPGLSMETAIINDLIPFIDETYNTLATKEGRMIGGISMGGYGAARFAIKYPELFSTALLLSPAVWQESQGNVCSSLHVFNNMEQETWEAEHPVAFLDSYVEANSPVNFYIIHGTEDAAVDPADVEWFVGELKAVGANVEYVPYEGGIHAWTTWVETCEQALIYAGSILTAE